jgi:hypothetical protein
MVISLQEFLEPSGDLCLDFLAVSLLTRVYATHVDLCLGLGFWRPR